MPRAPIVPLRIGNNGAYKAVRTSPAQGSCGVHSYPCMHPGVDVVGGAGTKVYAPENGIILYATDGNSAPFAGYGPWLIVMQGASGKFHLLGHLEPTTAALGPVSKRVAEGDLVGTTSSANHTHWEVRDKPWPPAGKTNFDNNSDPIAWLSGNTILLVGGLIAIGYALYAYWKRR